MMSLTLFASTFLHFWCALTFKSDCFFVVIRIHSTILSILYLRKAFFISSFSALYSFLCGYSHSLPVLYFFIDKTAISVIEF